MFRPRHAYKSPITNRYRGKAKGCPVFNNLNEITSNMVEQHDECLECLANIKNRSDLYKTLADNNKPSNNVIKSLQRLSSSASNNRLKTCLQFLIIKVNEKSVTVPKRMTTTNSSSPKSIHQDQSNSEHVLETAVAQTMKHLTKRQKSHHNQQQQLQLQKQKHNQLASPPQDQVSSTQDQVGNSQEEHDCQTSPMMPVVSTIVDNELHHDDDIKSIGEDIPLIKQKEVERDVDDDDNDDDDDDDNDKDNDNEDEEEYEQEKAFIKAAQTTQSSPRTEYSLEATTMTTSTSPKHHLIDHLVNHHNIDDTHEDNLTTSKFKPVNLTKPTKTITLMSTMTATTTTTSSSSTTSSITTTTSTRTSSTTTDIRPVAIKKRRRTQNSINSDHETSSIASWSSASYGGTSPPSPLSSASSTSSLSSDSSHTSSSSCSSTSSMPHSPSPSPLSSPDIINELKGPRLKLSEEKIRKIKKRPVLFHDIFYATEHQPPSFASTPTASSGFSPGQHSNATQNSDQSSSTTRSGFSSLSTSNMVIHMFQAPPTFVNNLKPCNLPTAKQQQQQPPLSSTPSPVTKVEMLNCAICGIKDKSPNISKIYGQNSCLLCTKFFASFLKRPQQLYCAQDGDCLMTFDSRCQACWIKICLQKFDIDEEHRKVGHKYSPKLLSSPSVSLITIDTSANS